MSLPAFSPSPLPEEMLYSVAARFHVLSANASSNDTCDTLFANQGGGWHHDFPCGVSAFARRSKCFDGNENGILNRLTILPFFEPFLSQLVADRIRTAMLVGDGTPIKFFLGLPPSQVDGVHPLRACFECIKCDTESTGFSYWHRLHQLPGVLMCPDHNCPLVNLPLKTNRLSKHAYLLPSDLDSTRTTDHATHDRYVSCMLVKLAIEARELMGAELPSLDPIRLWHTYRLGLRQHGLLTPQGNVRQEAFQHTFERHYTTLSTVPLFQRVLNFDAIAPFYSQLVRKPRRTKHPLKHLLLIDFLFGGCEVFKEIYFDAEVHAPRHRAHEEKQSATKGNVSAGVCHSRLNELLVHQGLSLRQAAELLGLSTSTVAVHAELAGIVVQRRAKKCTPSTKAAIITELGLGTPFGVIQEVFKVSLPTVHRLLQANETVRAARIQAKCQAKRAKYLAFRATHPGHLIAATCLCSAANAAT